MSLTPYQWKLLQELRADFEKKRNTPKQTSLFSSDDLPDYIHDRYGFLIKNPNKKRRY